MGNLFEDWDKGIAPPTQLLTSTMTPPQLPKVTPRKNAPRSEPAPAQTDNIFAKWDAGTPPIDSLLAERAANVEDYRTKLQKENAPRQEFFRDLPPRMQDDYQGVQDYLDYHAASALPSLPAPEKGKEPPGSGFSAQMKMDVLEDPETKRRVLAQTLFPNDEAGYGRVGFDVNGDPVYVGDDQKLHRIASGTARFGANMVANSPEMVAGTIGAFGGPLLASGAATGAHELKRSIIGGLIYDEPQTISGNLKEAASEFGMNLAGEALGRGMAGAINRGRSVELSPQEIKEGLDKIARVKAATGTQLTLAQATGDPQLIALQAFIARNPDATAKLMANFDKKARGDFADFTENVLDTVSKTPLPAESAGRKGINAAEAAIMLARKGAQQRVDPLYREAYRQTDAVMDPNVIQFFRHPEFRQAFREGAEIARL
ncbi:MAG TPA: hypothetical protein VKO87_12680, partial [Gemmatimonadaceae bacterium]|nr:hypothetical protein [Gemmatimonadaceae bacterium]